MDKTAAPVQENSTFESVPTRSSAMVSHSDTVAAPQGSSVFESKPTESKAHCKAGVENDEDEWEYETDDEA